MAHAPRSRRREDLAALATLVPILRPGLSVPGSGPLLQAPHAIAESKDALHGPGVLRVSLVASTTEGIVAEAFTAFSGGAVLTAWALHLGCSPILIAVLTAMPYLAQLVQLPAAWLTSTFGARRTALWAVALSRQVLLPLVSLPFLPISSSAKQVVLVCVALLSSVLAVIGNNGWVSWMGELVPKTLRGRYFGRRSALCTFGGSLAALLAGLALDGGKQTGQSDATLAGLALLACAAGAVTTWLMSRQADVEMPAVERFDLRLALQPYRDPTVRPVLAYQVVWNAAIGVSAAFYALHMVQNLKMGFALMALHGVATAFSRVVAGPMWGRAIDRFGSTPVLLACSFGIFFLPLIWLLPTEDRLWPLAIEAVVSGVSWSGHSVAAFALPLAVAPSRGRPFYLAAFASTGGIAFALASAAGGALLAMLPAQFELLGRQGVDFHILFILSAIARLAAAVVGFRIQEHGAKSAGALVDELVHEAAALPARLARDPRAFLRR